MNSWNKSFSIFYVTIADSTMLKNVNISKLNQILANLASKWDFKSGKLNLFLHYFKKYSTSAIYRSYCRIFPFLCNEKEY